MDRRSFLTAAAVAPLVGSAGALASTEDIAAPYLYTLTEPIPDHHLKPGAGDVALIVPGPLRLDSLQLLKDGRFAGVMLDWGRQGINTVKICGDESFTVPVDQLQSILAGQVIKIIMRRDGNWTEGNQSNAIY